MHRSSPAMKEAKSSDDAWNSLRALPVALGAPAILDGDLHLVEGPGMVDDRPDPGGIGWKPDAEHLREPGRDLPDLRRVVVDEDHGVWAELEFGRHLADGAGLR